MRFLKSLVLAAALFMPFNAYANNQDYAVLIDGDYTTSKDEHAQNVNNAYRCLKKQGYKDENIYVVSPKNPGCQNYSEGTVNNVRNVLDELSKKVDNTDGVLVYTTGHGGGYGNGDGNCEDGTFVFIDKNFTNRHQDWPKEGHFHINDLLAKLEKINADHFIYIGDQCYAGGFVKGLMSDTKIQKIVAMTAENEEEGYCKPYANLFWSTNEDIDGDGNVTKEEAEEFLKYNKDLNHDGVVTLKEAHAAASKYQRAKGETSTSQFKIKGLPYDAQISRQHADKKVTNGSRIERILKHHKMRRK